MLEIDRKLRIPLELNFIEPTLDCLEQTCMVHCWGEALLAGTTGTLGTAVITETSGTAGTGIAGTTGTTGFTETIWTFGAHLFIRVISIFFR